MVLMVALLAAVDTVLTVHHVPAAHVSVPPPSLINKETSCAQHAQII